MNTIVLHGELLTDDIEFDLPTAVRVCRLEQDQLMAMVMAGVVEVSGDDPSRWRFTGTALARARAAQRLSYDFDLEFEAVALILDLLDERAALKERVRWLEQLIDTSVGS